MIVGLSLSTRVIGLAAVKDGVLIDYKARFFKERFTSSKVDRMLAGISSFILDYPPQAVAMVLPPKHYRTPEAKCLMHKIKAYCKRKGIKVQVCQVHTLSLLYRDEIATKKALMKALSTLYPEIASVERRELRNKRRYYNKLFEAIGVATLLSREDITS